MLKYLLIIMIFPIFVSCELVGDMNEWYQKEVLQKETEEKPIQININLEWPEE